MSLPVAFLVELSWWRFDGGQATPALVDHRSRSLGSVGIGSRYDIKHEPSKTGRNTHVKPFCDQNGNLTFRESLHDFRSPNASFSVTDFPPNKNRPKNLILVKDWNPGGRIARWRNGKATGTIGHACTQAESSTDEPLFVQWPDQSRDWTRSLRRTRKSWT